MFAFVPPCSWYGGWLSFCIILALIGVMTALIGDIATTFGCLVGLKPEVTAITFVALGKLYFVLVLKCDVEKSS